LPGLRLTDGFILCPRARTADIEDDEPEQALTGLEEQALKEGAFDGDDELLKAVYAALEDKKEESQ
jgi:hypothetical protein